MVNAGKRKRRRSFTIALIQILLLCNSMGSTAPHLYAAPSAPGYLRLVRFMETDQVKLQNPGSLLYLGATASFLVLQETGDAKAGGKSAQVTAVTTFEDQLGATTLPQGVDPYNAAYDAKGKRLFFFDAATGELRQFAYTATGLPTTASMKPLALPKQAGAVRGMAIGADGQSLYLLDADTQQIRKFDLAADQLHGSAAAAIDLRQLGLTQARALAIHPQSGHLFTIDPTTRRLYELTVTGALVNEYDLAAAEIADAQGLAFAPSGDKTDDPNRINLYITDHQPLATSLPANANLRPSAYLPLVIGAGGVQATQSHGRLAELTFDPPIEPVLAAATMNTATLVQTIKTFQFTPPSPDPSDIAYISTTPYVLNGERLLISDAEVDEMAIYAGANLFEINFNGVLQQTYTTVTKIRNEITEEPAGLSFNPNNGHLFLCDDDNIRPVVEIDPGLDKIYRTSDDVVTKYGTRQYYGMDDPEGVEYARINNSDWLFLVDGLNSELHMVQPGPNGRFDGTDDVRTQYDTTALGVEDPEGIAYHPTTHTLYLVGKPATRLAEITLTGTLVRYIDITAAAARKPAGLAFAPNSQNPNQLSLYIVDRMVDNNSDPKENDGLVYEMSIPAAGNQPPAVDAGIAVTVPLTAGASLDGTVTDDGLPNPPATVTVTWSKVSGPGAVTFGNANSIDTTASFSLPGDYVLRLTASDGQVSNNDTVTVKVVVVNQPPVVNVGPNQNVEIGVPATLSAQVTDDGYPKPPGQVTVAWQKVSGPGTVNFTNATSANTTAGFSALGAYVLRVTASDSVLSASDEITITVLPTNTAPTVNAGGDQLVGRNDGATLIGSVSDDGLPNPPAQVAVTWSKTSGPGTVTFTAANAMTTTASFGAMGVYLLRFTVSDGALSNFDEVTITVGPPNQPPTVNAGPDQTVKLTATVTLTGTVSDDGIPNPPGAPRVHWQLQSGPGKVIFTDPQSLMTTVHFTATGLYILQLVADDGAQEATDTVTITVVDPNTSFVVLGQSRTAEVGKSLELSATIDGPWATLPTGTLTYQWSQLGGPATVTFATPTQATTTATFTAPGDYLLQLAITNGSEVISGTVTVTVNAINQRPRVNAGVDQNLARPGALELSAIITDDSLPGPTHKLTVQWTQMSGPAAVTFTNSSSLTTTVTFTTAGAYLLKVTADDSELIGEDTITILVGSEGAYKLFMPIMPR